MNRPDLLALDDDKLAALANRGLVKRARKMLEAGDSYTLEVHQDGTVELKTAEIEVRLPPGTPLKDCYCSCGASKTCRHRVFAVLAFQQQGPDAEEEAAWDPGTFSDQALEELLGERLLRRARQQMSRGMLVEVRPGPTPSALLPTCTVSFLVPNGLAYARCDCANEGVCEHIPLAVWAFRVAGEQDKSRIELGRSRDRSELLENAQQLVLELLLDGVVHAAEDLPERLDRGARELNRANMVWMADLAQDLAAGLRAYRSRSASFDSLRACARLLEWQARFRAAQGQGEMSQAIVLGLGEAPETQLEHIRLTGLGLRLSNQGDAAEAEVYLADPDTSTVLVLQRHWSSLEGLANRTVTKGIKLSDLAAGQLVTTAAKRRANRTLVVGRSRVAQSQCFAQQGNWEELLRPPLLVTDFAELTRRLADQGPSLLRPRVLAEHVYVLAVARVNEVLYDPGPQQLWAKLEDRQGNTIDLVSEYQSLTPGALPALAAALDDRLRYVSGQVRLESHGLTIEPLALVNDRVILPALEPDRVLELEPESLSDSSEPLDGLLRQALEHLSRGAHQGLRFAAAGFVQSLRETQQKLTEAGLAKLARDLDQVVTQQQSLRASDQGGPEAARAWVDASLRLRITRDTWLRRRLCESV